MREIWMWVGTELEQEEALHYLRGWLQNHPKYGALVPQDVANLLNPREVILLYRLQ
jgi:peroxin-5